MQEKDKAASSVSAEQWRQEAIRWQQLAQKRTKTVQMLNIVLGAVVVVALIAIVFLLSIWGLPGYVP